MPHGFGGPGREEASVRLRLRPVRELDQAQMRQERHLPDRGIRREARRATAPGRFPLHRPVRGRSAAVCRKGSERLLGGGCARVARAARHVRHNAIAAFRAVKKPKATWVRPMVEAEIEYAGVTDDGLLRAPVFKSLRDDLATAPVRTPPSCRQGPRQPMAEAECREKTSCSCCRTPSCPRSRSSTSTGERSANAPCTTSAAGRSSWSVTRGARRSITGAGCPRSRTPCTSCTSRSAKVARASAVWVDSVEGLLGLVQMDAVELHPWAATVDDIERPNRLIFDLDPGEEVAWAFVVDTALKLRTMLEDEGLRPWPKLTGGKGIHLMAPIEPSLTPRPGTHPLSRGGTTAGADRAGKVHAQGRPGAAPRANLH